MCKESGRRDGKYSNTFRDLVYPITTLQYGTDTNITA